MQYWLLMFMTLCLSSNALPKDRIVSLGSDITEIVFALNFGENIIARDTSSQSPRLAKQLPNVGNLKQINVQNILSMQPTLVLASDQTRPSALLQLQNAGVRVVKVTRGITLEAIPEKIIMIAKYINQTNLGEQLIQKFYNELNQVNTSPLNKNVLFIMDKGAVLPLMAGLNTPADKLITLVGAKNAMANFEQYRPLSPEHVIAGQPDLIVVSHSSVKPLGGTESIWRLPGMSMTPAGRHKALVIVDDMGILHFSLGTPKVMQQIRQALEKLEE